MKSIEFKSNSYLKYFINLPKILFIYLFFLGAYLNLLSPLKASTDNSATKVENYRIVALTSLSADVINSLSNESLVGIPGSSLLNKNVDFENKTIISSGRMPPNLEKILKLKPDLVIGSNGFHDKTLKSIEKLGIKTISLSIRNFSDLEEMFSNFQVLLGKNNSVKLNNIIRNCYRRSSKRKQNNKEILVLVSSKPILSPNSKSWAGSMIDRFDYINLTSELDSKSQFKGYVNLSTEWVVSSKPENLIIINTPGSSESQYKEMSIWNHLNAVKNDKVFSFDYYGLINPGSLNSIDNACRKLSSI